MSQENSATNAYCAANSVEEKYVGLRNEVHPYSDPTEPKNLFTSFRKSYATKFPITSGLLTKALLASERKQVFGIASSFP